MKLEFEEIETNTRFWVKRAKIFGGWIVVIISDIGTENQIYESNGIYIADFQHQWTLE